MSGKASGRKARNARHAARLAAVQALYQMDMAGTGHNDVIHEFTEFRFRCAEYVSDADSRPDATFFSEIVSGAVRRQRDIDPEVDQQLAQGWRLVRVDSTLRAILRSAMFELLDRPDVPVRVVINEYIEIARDFFGEDEPKVVNGILHNLAQRFRADEMKTISNGS
ncbi:MAG: transcription antitermination factor NusB [Hyphomicrobiaceae bacterium TMED74]|nr:transcription antitermination factor NusB [Filomicrobium sp.]RPG41106.1 MAG: transcription antitermination factor NusB [Hyphomicrobiaceae bacterium TMED74]